MGSLRVGVEVGGGRGAWRVMGGLVQLVVIENRTGKIEIWNLDLIHHVFGDYVRVGADLMALLTRDEWTVIGEY